MNKTSFAICFAIIFCRFQLCREDNELPSLEYGTLTDIEGYTYKTVRIGDQWWMAENLHSTKYRNGDEIMDATVSGYPDTLWMKLNTGAYTDSYGDITDRSFYGYLYNWYAINDKRNIAPAGWHIPSDSDWTKLSTFLGGDAFAGRKLKDKNSSHWWSPWNNTNETGFTAFGGGYYGSLYNMNWSEILYLWFRGYWWSSTENNSDEAWCRYLDDDLSEMIRTSLSKNAGCSIRCIKDY